MQANHFAINLRADNAGRRLERNFLDRAGGAIRETRETARAVAAHLRFAAVGVVIAHAEIRTVRRFFQNQNAVRPDASMPIADARDLVAGECQVSGTIVEQ